MNKQQILSRIHRERTLCGDMARSRFCPSAWTDSPAHAHLMGLLVDIGIATVAPSMEYPGKFTWYMDDGGRKRLLELTREAEGMFGTMGHGMEPEPLTEPELESLEKHYLNLWMLDGTLEKNGIVDAYAFTNLPCSHGWNTWNAMNVMYFLLQKHWLRYAGNEWHCDEPRLEANSPNRLEPILLELRKRVENPMGGFLKAECASGTDRYLEWHVTETEREREANISLYERAHRPAHLEIRIREHADGSYPCVEITTERAEREIDVTELETTAEGLSVEPPEGDGPWTLTIGMRRATYTVTFGSLALQLAITAQYGPLANQCTRVVLYADFTSGESPILYVPDAKDAFENETMLPFQPLEPMDED